MAGLEDDEWEVVDELLVHVDLAELIQSQGFSDGQQLNTKFIGLDTDRPIVQIGSQVLIQSKLFFIWLQVACIIYICLSWYITNTLRSGYR